MKGRLVLLGAGQKTGEAWACGEEGSEGGEAVQAESLIVLDAGNSLGKEKAG